MRGWWNCDDGERLVELAICYDLMIRLLTGGYTEVESLEIASPRMETPGEYKGGLTSKLAKYKVITLSPV